MFSLRGRLELEKARVSMQILGEVGTVPSEQEACLVVRKTDSS